MSELDGMSPMDREEFKRKYIDSMTELKAQSLLGGATSEPFRQKSTIAKHPEDKGAKQVSKHKKKFERDGAEKQRGKLMGYLGDALSVRQKEILNKNDYSIKDLISHLIKLMPQQVDQVSDVNMNFADMVKSVTLEKKRYRAIDAEEA